MKTARFNTPRNFKYNKRLHATKTSGEIFTVPDEAFTIEEILQRFTKGIDPYLTKTTFGHETIEQDDFDDVPVNFKPDLSDLTEAENFITETKDRVKEFTDWKLKHEGSNTIEKGVTDPLPDK